MHPLTLSPSHPLTLSPSHPPTLSLPPSRPSHSLTLAPSHGVGTMPPRHVPGSASLCKRRHHWLELTFENFWLDGELTFGNLFQECGVVIMAVAVHLQGSNLKMGNEGLHARCQSPLNLPTLIQTVAHLRASASIIILPGIVFLPSSAIPSLLGTKLHKKQEPSTKRSNPTLREILLY